MSAAGGLAPVATPPQPGPLYVAPTQPGVKLVVGRFDAVVGRLKPDMKECAQPLRMRKKAGERTMATISGSAAAVAGAEDANRVLELSDAHGEHVLLGTKEKLESHYIAITRTTGPDGQLRYYAAPVDEWFTFASAPDLPARSAEEEAELQDKLLRFGERPTAAALMRRRVGEAFRDEGGEAASSMEVTTGDGVVGGSSAGTSRGVGADEDDDSNNYRAHAARHTGGRGGGAGGAGGEGMLGEFAPDDLDGAYDALDAGAGGDGENAGAGGGGGGYAGGYGGGGDGEEGGVAEGRTFDVFGREADAEEVAADLDICFDDDAGDAGEEADAAQANLGADDAEVAANAGEEEEVEGVDVEGDDQDAAAVNRKYAAMLSKQAKGAAGAGAGAGAGAEGERGPDGKRRRAAAGLGAAGALGAGAGAGGAGGEAPAAKRARMEVAAKYQDPLTALRQRLRSVVVAHGGRVTMQAVGRAFKAELRGSQGDVFRATLTDVMKAMLRRVIAPDGVTTVYVFRENTK